MPVYQDTTTKKWFCKFYYTDYNGQKKQKKKRGFTTKREAQAFEREFLANHTQDITMSLETFSRLYLDDLKKRVKYSTYTYKEHITRNHIIPYLGDKPLNEITPAIVRQWQNTIMEKKNPRLGKSYEPSYIHKVNSVLSSIFVYANRFYGLENNPCSSAGTVGTKKTSTEMKIWTVQQFNQFLEVEKDPMYSTLFNTLFYTGLRVGELLALTWNDIDFNAHTISINKSLSIINGKEVIEAPKTSHSIRTIAIFPYLEQILIDYKNALYELKNNDFLFSVNRDQIRYELNKKTKEAGLDQIRIHDFRHSHASMMIELGFNPLMIANRLGHEDIQTTLNTYSHLYPNKEKEAMDKIQEYITKTHEI